MSSPIKFKAGGEYISLQQFLSINNLNLSVLYHWQIIEAINNNDLNLLINILETNSIHIINQIYDLNMSYTFLQEEGILVTDEKNNKGYTFDFNPIKLAEYFLYRYNIQGINVNE